MVVSLSSLGSPLISDLTTSSRYSSSCQVSNTAIVTLKKRKTSSPPSKVELSKLNIVDSGGWCASLGQDLPQGVVLKKRKTSSPSSEVELNVVDFGDYCTSLDRELLLGVSYAMSSSSEIVQMFSSQVKSLQIRTSLYSYIASLSKVSSLSYQSASSSNIKQGFDRSLMSAVGIAICRQGSSKP